MTPVGVRKYFPSVPLKTCYRYQWLIFECFYYNWNRPRPLSRFHNDRPIMGKLRGIVINGYLTLGFQNSWRLCGKGNTRSDYFLKWAIDGWSVLYGWVGYCLVLRFDVAIGLGNPVLWLNIFVDGRAIRPFY